MNAEITEIETLEKILEKMFSAGAWFYDFDKRHAFFVTDVPVMYHKMETNRVYFNRSIAERLQMFFKKNIDTDDNRRFFDHAIITIFQIPVLRIHFTAAVHLVNELEQYLLTSGYTND